MFEKTVDVPTADGTMETFVTHPESGGPFARVVLLMDVWGIREQLRDIALQIACVGYTVVLPNIGQRAFRLSKPGRDDRVPEGFARSGAGEDPGLPDTCSLLERSAM